MDVPLMGGNVSKEGILLFVDELLRLFGGEKRFLT